MDQPRNRNTERLLSPHQGMYNLEGYLYSARIGFAGYEVQKRFSVCSQLEQAIDTGSV